MAKQQRKLQIERVQTGVRLESKMLKVLKGIAEHHNYTLGQMLELIVLHAFENRSAFSKDGFEAVRALKKVYGLDYDVHAYKGFVEK